MSERLRWLLGVAWLPPAALLVLLALLWLLPAPGAVTLAGRASESAERMTATLDAMPDQPVVAIGFDPDLGTYAEVRPAVRALLADLLERDARLVVVSLTPDGRALFLAELSRLRASGLTEGSIVEVGFVPGAEAALVAVSRSAPAPGAPEGLAAELRVRGLGAADLVAVIGGIDIGPRSWVEQFLPRVGGIPLVAIVPTVLLPELLPYVESGQLDALVGTPSDGASYRASTGLGSSGAGADRMADPLALLLGVVIAIGVIGHAVAARLVPRRLPRSIGEHA